jgi:uncharacterized tannase-like protein DUF6351
VIIEENDLTTDTAQDENANAYELSAMNQWLNDVSHDQTAWPAQAKITSDKPAGLADGCFLTDQQTTPTPQPGGLTADGLNGPCESAYPAYSNTRIAAGQPEDLYALKCALQPVNWASYPVAFTPAEKAELERAFPHGVCDYSEPGPDEEPPAGTWLNYSRGTQPFRS